MRRCLRDFFRLRFPDIAMEGRIGVGEATGHTKPSMAKALAVGFERQHRMPAPTTRAPHDYAPGKLPLPLAPRRLRQHHVWMMMIIITIITITITVTITIIITTTTTTVFIILTLTACTSTRSAGCSAWCVTEELVVIAFRGSLLLVRIIMSTIPHVRSAQ